MLQKFTIQAFIKRFVESDGRERQVALGKLCRTIVHGDPDTRAHKTSVAILDEVFEHLGPEARYFLAKHLAPSAHAPRSIILSLLDDEPEIAEVILTDCPFIGDEPIISALASAQEALQIQIAQRSRISVGLAVFIARHCSLLTNVSLVTNAGANLSPKAFNAIVDRFSNSDEMCDILLARQDLPIGEKQRLRSSIAERGCALFLNPRMNARYQKIKLTQAAELATLELSNELNLDMLRALVQHLISTEQMTPSLLMRAIVMGHHIFIAESLAMLGDVPAKRVAGLMRSGDLISLRALFHSVDIGERITEALIMALEVAFESDRLHVTRTLRPMNRPEIDWLINRLEVNKNDMFDDYITLLRVLTASFSLDDSVDGETFSVA